MMAYPTGARWDVSSQDYELDSDGAVVVAHPVDAAVVARIGWRRGTVAGDPTLGHTLLEVDTSLDYAGRQTDILRRQITSLGSLVTDKLVDSVSVEHEFTGDGRMSVVTRYRNMKTGRSGTVIA